MCGKVVKNMQYCAVMPSESRDVGIPLQIRQVVHLVQYPASNSGCHQCATGKFMKQADVPHH